MQDGVHVSEGSLVSVEAKDETPERRTLQKKPSKLKTATEAKRPKELALHSLGGAAARVTSKEKIAKTSHRAGILIATMFAGDSDSDSDSEDENGLPKPKRIGRLRAGRDYIIGILQKYSIPLVFGVCLAMVWSNLDEESYLQMAHWTPIADFKLGGHAVDLHFVINDFFMCFFFGLAIKEAAKRWENLRIC
eukprot:g27536.t1